MLLSPPPPPPPQTYRRHLSFPPVILPPLSLSLLPERGCSVFAFFFPTQTTPPPAGGQSRSHVARPLPWSGRDAKGHMYATTFPPPLLLLYLSRGAASPYGALSQTALPLFLALSFPQM
ncbi:hypothetical protein H696_04644 [Fonticula alba]|uniref:Uncharacterized protein n=1 Tax=Fonticula alba TaxID=691883 RepID=A0A058Z6R4_FONAL|nr:hypothetical protein H696_04644 [Fonticula alba]KCV69227.1 hypothetical protein H696_04644 [Fonticula alba]|eukprot:XP_009496798.1 hypothetical protein H696_04644 [Fonticula alba]